MDTTKPINVGVHATHCCKFDGCKYGYGDRCPVTNGQVVQAYPCVYCPDESAYKYAKEAIKHYEWLVEQGFHP